MDLGGLAIAVAIGGVLAALGVGIDSLLLKRHVKAADDLALKWWLYFDGLVIKDIPRIAVGVYLRAKDRVLGRGFSFSFLVRSSILSLVLTALTVPGGRALGLALLLKCNEIYYGASEPEFSLWRHLQIGWGWTGLQSILYLVPVNVAFDLATIFVTIVILSKALEKPNYFLLALILVDILACVVLFHHALYIADEFDNASTVSVGGYWTVIPNLLQAFSFGCSSFHILTSKLLFISTILLPTIIYLVMIVALFFLVEGFRLLRWLSMYVLEKSVEDSKTIFAHVGVSIGLAVSAGKAALEILKAL